MRKIVIFVIALFFAGVSLSQELTRVALLDLQAKNTEEKLTMGDLRAFVQKADAEGLDDGAEVGIACPVKPLGLDPHSGELYSPEWDTLPARNIDFDEAGVEDGAPLGVVISMNDDAYEKITGK